MAARRVSAEAVVSYFTGDNDGLAEMFFEGSDDDLGMDDELSDDEEPGSDGDKQTVQIQLSSNTE